MPNLPAAGEGLCKAAAAAEEEEEEEEDEEEDEDEDEEADAAAAAQRAIAVQGRRFIIISADGSKSTASRLSQGLHADTC
jgi:hypothetical protein